ncbi:phosphodiesterase [Vallitalea okinawensis]|uniref:phosphodiesterase n=1 Tax=Vallitalea okinawensis TaxID=2078660 RepID=UPI000CFC6316|nr:phosphodiesterase [Vallitalea okinawensis]
MKLFFMSDIHGSIIWLEKALEKFEEEQADYIVLLGDALYHGPRNPIPEGYDPKAVITKLNAYKDKIIAVRGNCDSEVDQMVIEFPIMADYAILFYNGRRIFATHGHLFNRQQLPNISKGDILVHGHTHIPVAEAFGDNYIFNPGSITLPKEENPHSYGVLEQNEFKVKDFDGNCIRQVMLPS